MAQPFACFEDENIEKTKHTQPMTTFTRWPAGLRTRLSNLASRRRCSSGGSFMISSRSRRTRSSLRFCASSWRCRCCALKAASAAIALRATQPVQSYAQEISGRPIASDLGACIAGVLDFGDRIDHSKKVAQKRLLAAQGLNEGRLGRVARLGLACQDCREHIERRVGNGRHPHDKAHGQAMRDCGLGSRFALGWWS